HKVTIIPRGRTLGVTQFLPDDERFSVGERRLRSQLVMALGGRAAEKLIFDEYSAGAENDLKQATKLARRMVSSWGMSDVVGPVAFSTVDENPFLGREIHEHRDHSDDTARIIDQEVQRFLMEAQEQATDMLRENRDKLERIVEALKDRETLGKAELIELIGERPTAETNGRPSVRER
ncbi:MAG: ATP-dependent zinc metalloprotease FtsH, partial [Planctomycetaceae bacterium]